MLLPIFGADRPDMALVVFTYVSGFVGILLAPAAVVWAADWCQ